jgi:hypothetical protein
VSQLGPWFQIGLTIFACGIGGLLATSKHGWRASLVILGLALIAFDQFQALVNAVHTLLGGSLPKVTMHGFWTMVLCLLAVAVGAAWVGLLIRFGSTGIDSASSKPSVSRLRAHRWSLIAMGISVGILALAVWFVASRDDQIAVPHGPLARSANNPHTVPIAPDEESRLAGAGAPARDSSHCESQQADPNADTIWVRDRLPEGAQLPDKIRQRHCGDRAVKANPNIEDWWWCGYDPAPVIGSKFAVQPQRERSTDEGYHEHSFTGAPFAIRDSDYFVTYVYIYPDHAPHRIMIKFHIRGEDWRSIYWGEAPERPPGRRLDMGPMPAAGKWQRLTVPMNGLYLQRGTTVELDGLTLQAFNGQAAWDHIGKCP